MKPLAQTTRRSGDLTTRARRLWKIEVSDGNEGARMEVREPKKQLEGCRRGGKASKMSLRANNG